MFSLSVELYRNRCLSDFFSSSSICHCNLPFAEITSVLAAVETFDRQRNEALWNCLSLTDCEKFKI